MLIFLLMPLQPESVHLEMDGRIIQEFKEILGFRLENYYCYIFLAKKLLFRRVQMAILQVVDRSR